MASGIFFQFDARDNTVVVLPTLRTILVLPFARVALLKLKWQGARVILPNCAGHLAQMGPDLCSNAVAHALYTTLGQLVTSCHRLN